MPNRILIVAAVVCLGAFTVHSPQEYKSGIEWERPRIVAPGPTEAAPPSDAVVLFDGQDLSQWDGGEKWEIKDGYAIARETSITTKQSFGDCQLHLEWAAPEKVEGEGQGRGNSGVYLMNRYEIQILDSYENETYFDGQAGAIYKQWPPLVNVCRKPGEWQSFDVLFEAPRFDEDGQLTRPAYVTLVHNGVVIHNHSEILGTTSYTDPPKYAAHAAKEPIQLQFHGNPVRFRNIWIRELSPRTAGYPQPSKSPEPK
ncbi:MAG TPA: DUF1080 domain-containing protein [Planctomycetaceae bacterium]|nr:DUF1080 domain-containing protein [Planctomycetaceae bacterium]